MEVVTSFIAMLEDTIIPTVKVRSFPNQKTWVDGSIGASLNARTAAYNSGLVSSNMDKYKAASYGLWQARKDTKRRHRDTVEAQMEKSDIRHLWQGLRTIKDYRGRTPSTESADTSRANNLNSFDVRFEASNNTPSGPEVSSIARDEHTLSVTEHDVKRAYCTPCT